jgi:hypothetical protein
VKKIKYLVFLSIIFKLIVIFASHPIKNFDLVSYQKIGKLTVDHINIYPYPANIHYPYLPFYLYLEALAYLVRNIIPIDITLKIINLIFDSGAIFLFFILSKNNYRQTFFYAFNPVTISIFYFHGQFDAIPIFFVLLSLYFLRNKNEILFVLFYLTSIFIKTWPVFFIILFFKKTKNKKLFIYLPLIFFLFTLVYLFVFKSNFFAIIRTILSYRSIFNTWGIGKLIYLLFFRNLDQPPIFIQKILITFFLIVLFTYSIKLKVRSIITAVFNLLLFFFVFTVGFSIQYLSWIMPFLLLERPRFWWVLNFVIATYLFFVYLQWILNKNIIAVSPINTICWLTFVFFFGYWNKNRIKTT